MHHLSLSRRAARRLCLLAAALLCGFGFGAAATPAARAQSIDVAPGASPAGYIPLSAFGGNFIPAGMGDETVANLDVPAFVYAGQTWTRLGLTSNGYLVVGGGTDADVTPANTAALPDPDAPDNVLAPFWTDLDLGPGGTLLANVLTDGVDSWIVVEWNAVPLKGQPSQTNTFQVWIGVNGVEDISFVYGAVSAPAALTVGAEDETGTVGEAYFFDGAGTRPAQGTELRVTSSGLPVDTAADLIAGLIGQVRGLGLPRGTANSFVVKLEAALAALEAGDAEAARDSLQGFINHARAQSGKKLTKQQADALIAEAEAIRAALAGP